MRYLPVLSLLCAALPLFASGQGKIRPRDAASYALKDVHDGVTIAAEVYGAGAPQTEKIKEAFGKYDPREHSILPVYIVIFNPTHDAIKLDAAEMTFETSLQSGRFRQKLRQMTGEEASRRVRGGIVGPKGIKHGKVKGPIEEILGQEFVVKMIPPGDTVGGFLYFEDPSSSSTNWTLLLNGLRWASSGRELLYFEIHHEASAPDSPGKSLSMPIYCFLHKVSPASGNMSTAAVPGGGAGDKVYSIAAESTIARSQ